MHVADELAEGHIGLQGLDVAVGGRGCRYVKEHEVDAGHDQRHKQHHRSDPQEPAVAEANLQSPHLDRVEVQ